MHLCGNSIGTDRTRPDRHTLNPFYLLITLLTYQTSQATHHNTQPSITSKNTPTHPHRTPTTQRTTEMTMKVGRRRHGVFIVAPGSQGRSSTSPCCHHRRRHALSALSIAHVAVMDRHAASTPSRSDASSAAPARDPLIVRRDHCAGAAVTAAVMPRSPLQQPAVDTPSLLGPPPLVG